MKGSDGASERTACGREAGACFLSGSAPLPTPSAFERDAAILRFEYTVEATWRAAQRYLAISEALSAGSPKATVRFSRQVGVLTDEESTQALKMMDDRNLTVHTYHEAVADEIRGRLPGHAILMEQWFARIGVKINQREGSG